jgi:hypothetical protein
MLRALVLILALACPCFAGTYEACVWLDVGSTTSGEVCIIKPSGYAWSANEKGSRTVRTEVNPKTGRKVSRKFKIVKMTSADCPDASYFTYSGGKIKLKVQK